MPKYTKAQKKAYHSGRAYRLGKEGRKIKFSSADNLESFRNGYRNMGKKLDKYSKLK